MNTHKSHAPYDILLRRNILEPWTSMREILPSIELAWGRVDLKSNIPIKSLCLEIKNVSKNLNYLLGARRIIIPKLNESFAWWVILLRSGFNYKGQFIIHEHGETSKGRYSTINPYLRNDDIMLVASQASMKTAKLLYPKMTIRLVPFPILSRLSDKAELSRVKKTKKNSKICLAYIGRISEQKNLHTLILSLWILKNNYKVKLPILNIFGSSDGLGSPNMGMKFKKYDSYLKKLVHDLNLDSNVKWHGECSREFLHNWVKQNSHVFISPSLHSDENFGVAAFTSLAFGNKAVLSDWGGHKDLALNFGNTNLVPVRLSDSGPTVSPIDLASAIKMALNKKTLSRVGVPSYFTVESVVKLLNQLEKLEPTSKKNILLESGLLKKIEKRKEGLRGLRASNSASLVFSGYNDKLAFPFFVAYGAKKIKRPRIDTKKQYVVAPWVKIAKNQITVSDPHRGEYIKKIKNLEDKIERKRAMEWLVKNGYAF